MHSTSIFQYRGFGTAGCLTVAQLSICAAGAVTPCPAAWANPEQGTQDSHGKGSAGNGMDVTQWVTKWQRSSWRSSVTLCTAVVVTGAQGPHSAQLKAALEAPAEHLQRDPLTPSVTAPSPQTLLPPHPSAPPSLVPGLCSSHGTPQDTRGGWTVSVTWQHLWALPKRAPGYTGISHTGQYRDV